MMSESILAALGKTFYNIVTAIDISVASYQRDEVLEQLKHDVRMELEHARLETLQETNNKSDPEEDGISNALRIARTMSAANYWDRY